jgi:hypothetical protein
MDSTVSKSIEQTLDSIQELTQSLSCRLITLEGPWHVCSQRCDLPQQLLVTSSLQAKEYLFSKKEIHLMDKKGSTSIQSFLFIIVPCCVHTIDFRIDGSGCDVVRVRGNRSLKKIQPRLFSVCCRHSFPCYWQFLKGLYVIYPRTCESFIRRTHGTKRASSNDC